MAAARRIPSAPTAQPVLPDEILEEIFLRLDAAADLARTSAACSSFRRLISARRFLRRFRSLHSPPVLGLLDDEGYGGSRLPVERFIPIEPPHRSAPAARALARAADFTFSFLPDACSWRPRDSRDGRVVLSRRVANAAAFDDLVVCDPLHRRYVMIPPIPDDLTASITKLGKNFEPFLAPAGDGKDEKLKDEEESSLRVICTVRFENKFIAFFFSSANQKWGLITYHSSSSFGYRRCYAHGCFFWVVDSNGYALMLDTRQMKFSIIDLPPNNDVSNIFAFVEAGEGRLGLLTLVGSTIDLSCKIWRNNGAGAEGWQHCKMIPLPKDCGGINYIWYIMGAAERYLNLLALHMVHRESPAQYFILDIKTLLLERLCTLNARAFLVSHLYASFPPLLAPPSL
ncbi:hypothetical protein SETIT_3G337000v2 [Setaria italica]|uniref:F-box domain-containing protein n=1 Tax=Setaria italica TaxID=4555 RepID=K3ZCT5_SETIT|nr:hypothetical protein SETIT_3G337000v2 [Setaria italica]